VEAVVPLLLLGVELLVLDLLVAEMVEKVQLEQMRLLIRDLVVVVERQGLLREATLHQPLQANQPNSGLRQR